MLHQLEFKLHVERQYKEGIDKMAKLYLVDGDKKARYVDASSAVLFLFIAWLNFRRRSQSRD